MLWVVFALGVLLFVILFATVLRLVLKGANSGESRYLLGTRHPGSHPGLISSDYSQPEEKEE